MFFSSSPRDRLRRLNGRFVFSSSEGTSTVEVSLAKDTAVIMINQIAKVGNNKGGISMCNSQKDCLAGEFGLLPLSQQPYGKILLITIVSEQHEI